MITDNETNKIYFSEKLKTNCPQAHQNIDKVLKSFGLQAEMLQKTNDIWARDYMPIQINEDEFIEYRYDPDYLQGKFKGLRDLKTYPDIVCDYLNLKTTKTDIILDGGNVVKSKNCLIMTDKVILENKHHYTKNDLVKKIKETFRVDELVLIPWDKLDRYGHSDGILRFITEDTVLVSEIYEYDDKLLSTLKRNRLKWEFLRVKIKRQNKWNWAYINFLQTKDLIILPKFDIDEDYKALTQLEKYYPDYAAKGRIAQVEIKDIAEMHGALNCISWTIKTN